MTPVEREAELNFLNAVQRDLHDHIAAISEHESKLMLALHPRPYRNDELQTLKMNLVAASDMVIEWQKALVGLPD